MNWGWEVSQLPASVLAAEPWPPDALPLSLYPLSKTPPPLRAPGTARPAPSSPISPTVSWGTGRPAREPAVAPSSSSTQQPPGLHFVAGLFSLSGRSKRNVCTCIQNPPMLDLGSAGEKPDLGSCFLTRGIEAGPSALHDRCKWSS